MCLNFLFYCARPGRPWLKCLVILQRFSFITWTHFRRIYREQPHPRLELMLGCSKRRFHIITYRNLLIYGNLLYSIAVGRMWSGRSCTARRFQVRLYIRVGFVRRSEWVLYSPISETRRSTILAHWRVERCGDDEIRLGNRKSAPDTSHAEIHSFIESLAPSVISNWTGWEDFCCRIIARADTTPALEMSFTLIFIKPLPRSLLQ